MDKLLSKYDITVCEAEYNGQSCHVFTLYCKVNIFCKINKTEDKYILEPIAGDKINSEGWFDMDIDGVIEYCNELEDLLNKNIP